MLYFLIITFCNQCEQHICARNAEAMHIEKQEESTLCMFSA